MRAIQRRCEAWTSCKNSRNATSANAYLHLNKSNGGRGEYCGPQTQPSWPPKKVFAHVNRNKRMGTRIRRLLHPDGSPATIDQEMADLLKQAFQGFYRKDRGSTPTFHSRTDIRMANPNITESETQRALEALNPNKGACPDGLFPKALKTLSPYTAATLSRIFNLSLQRFHQSDVCCMQNA